jgi:protein involved in polysaccharide export with SLBB domain
MQVVAQNDLYVGSLEDRMRGGGSIYDISDPTTINMKVSLFGFIKSPGKYIIPQKTNLLDLLAYSGGIVEGAEPEKVRIFRKNESGKTFVLEYNYKALLMYEMEEFEKMPSESPLLLPGDIIVVPGSEPDDYILRYMQLGLASLSLLINIYYLVNS